LKTTVVTSSPLLVGDDAARPEYADPVATEAAKAFRVFEAQYRSSWISEREISFREKPFDFLPGEEKMAKARNGFEFAPLGEAANGFVTDAPEHYSCFGDSEGQPINPGWRWGLFYCRRDIRNHAYLFRLFPTD
jgi:hypothetical protein